MSLMLNSNSDDSETLYSDSVFSTYLYTGNNSTQTITNGIDLAGKGGLVWIKDRTSAWNNILFDTARGAGNALISNSTQAQPSTYTDFSSFNSNGFSVAAPNFTSSINSTGDNYVSWTFREAAKFFDVVTYTGNGTNRTIPHSLGLRPGMIIIKRTDAIGDWYTWHVGASGYFGNIFGYLNTTSAFVDQGPSTFGYLVDTGITNTVFSVDTSSTTTNITGATYVAYLFAHNTAADSMIKCGSYTGNGSSTNPPNIELGWEAQFILLKESSGSRDWVIVDNMRGLGAPSSVETAVIKPNLEDAEVTFTSGITITATGFQPRVAGIANLSGSTNIYMAIRRPNKPPTSGTEVYNAFLSNTATPGGVPKFLSNFPVDMFMFGPNIDGGTNMSLHPRLTQGKGLTTSSTAVEEGAGNYSSSLKWDYNIGVHDGGSFYEGTPDMGWMFKRAPGFFDVVCYTGTGVARTVAHNLGVVPELILFKRRDGVGLWIMYAAPTGISKFFIFNWADAAQIGSCVDSVAPTISEFSISPNQQHNVAGGTAVAYLFATLAGISKVGSYTGNGSSQNINCGFAAGARFILIKRTDAAGDWYVWDTTRGIAAANDPHLSLNSTAAEVTTDDSIDPDAPGFIVNQLAATNINVSAATYIFLAIS